MYNELQSLEQSPGGVSGERPAPVQELANLDRIARSSVQLAELGPRLASVAADMERQAEEQARSAGAIAEATGTLVVELERAMAELGSSSKQVSAALATVRRIADHTRLLSINASIEAARAGVVGRAFSVIVDEVQQLADNTGRATGEIGAHMEEMLQSVSRVAAVAGCGASEAASRKDSTIEAVNEQVRGMAASVQRQHGGARKLHGMGDQIKVLTESLLLAVGMFRFDAHVRASRAVEAFAPSLAGLRGDRAKCESALGRWLHENAFFELAYVTDAKGRQFVDNIGRREGRIVHDPSGYGRDWSQRPWFRAALASCGVCATDIYRSTATGDFCFTVAAALHSPDGKVACVVGADVNFQRLVASDRP